MDGTKGEALAAGLDTEQGRLLVGVAGLLMVFSSVSVPAGSIAVRLKWQASRKSIGFHTTMTSYDVVMSTVLALNWLQHASRRP